jgi:hypothetical protein
MTLRDPFERTLSAFVFLHPVNVKARTKRMRGSKKAARNFFSCFPDLDTFVEALGDEPDEYEYPWPSNVANTTNCRDLARASMDNKVKGFEHVFFDTKYVVNHLPDSWRHNQTMLVIRRENLWNDWTSANKYLGQEHVATFPDKSLRVASQHKQPVSKNITTANGRIRLCRALAPEYRAFLDVIKSAVNLSQEQKQKSLQLARKNCPNLKLAFATA